MEFALRFHHGDRCPGCVTFAAIASPDAPALLAMEAWYRVGPERWRRPSVACVKRRILP